MRVVAVALLLICALVALPLRAQPPADPFPVATTRDGTHDFDFLDGHWRTHYRRLGHILSHSHDWYDCNGASVVTPFWNHGGNLEDGDLACPHAYIGGMTLRIYNAQTHQWALYWGTRKGGIDPEPPQVGHFDADGVGTFYAPYNYRGTYVICRFRWTLRLGDHPRFEQAFSSDGGKTWETNWTTDYTRSDDARPAPGSPPPAKNNFDFMYGRWSIHYKRLAQRLRHSNAWTTCDGSSVVRPFWGGSGNIEDGRVRCGTSSISAIVLRTYDAATNHWTLYWGSTADGFSPIGPSGRFDDASGIGEFFSNDTENGTSIIVRQTWKRDARPHFEQAFSADQGATWETNWYADYTRR